MHRANDLLATSPFIDCEHRHVVSSRWTHSSIRNSPNRRLLWIFYSRNLRKTKKKKKRRKENHRQLVFHWILVIQQRCQFIFVCLSEGNKLTRYLITRQCSACQPIEKCLPSFVHYHFVCSLLLSSLGSLAGRLLNWRLSVHSFRDQINESEIVTMQGDTKWPFHADS